MNRDKMGRFVSNFFWRLVFGIMRWLRRLAVVCAFGWVFFAGYMWSELDHSNTVYAAAFTSDVVIQGLNIEAVKEDLVNRLAKKENEGGLPAYLDDNSRGTLSKKDKLSYGCMAYKLSTVQRHWKGIHGTSLNDLEAALLAMDCPKAKELAKDAIFKLDAINEWTAATAEMKAEVAIIRKWSK